MSALPIRGPGDRGQGTPGGGPIILAIDASTYAGSAALVRGSAVLAECTVAMRGEREERLMPAIAAMIDGAGLEPNAIGAVVCGAGPGSFTSLRIAASIAKGLAVSLDRPLHAVSSLLLVVAGAQPALPAGRYAVLVDAMRRERYAVTVEVREGEAPRLTSGVSLVADEDAIAYASAAGATAVGPAVGAGTAPHARGVARLGPPGGAGSPLVPVDIALWEPDYGRLAEAQVKWEAAHGRPLTSA